MKKKREKKGEKDEKRKEKEKKKKANCREDTYQCSNNVMSWDVTSEN